MNISRIIGASLWYIEAWIIGIIYSIAFLVLLPFIGPYFVGVWALKQIKSK